MSQSNCPSLYQIDTRKWISKLSEKIGGPLTLDDIPNSELEKFCRSGFQWIWLTNVWQAGPDLKERDIVEKLAISSYRVDDKLGGNAALFHLRKRMQDFGLKLMLDFITNHSAIDNEWVNNFPEYYVQGNETLLVNEPGNYIKIKNECGELILAHGKDPFSPGRPDTLQLNYGNPAMQRAMMNELIKVSGLCDGVHCEMPMLVFPGVFEKTWNIQSKPFWKEAIKGIKEINPDFRFVSEVYWDQEGMLLQQQGFDHTYIASNDMIIKGRLSQSLETAFVESSIIAQEANYNDIRTIPINYLIPKADAC